MSLFIKQCGALLLYCLPAMIALTVVLKNYHHRALEVSADINRYAVASRDLDADQLKAFQDTFVQDNEVAQRLFHFFNNYRTIGIGAEHDLIGEINSTVLSVWAFNSSLILAPTLLPYLLLGARLVFGPTTKVDRSTRLHAARHEYVVAVDVFSMNTLPIYIDSQNLLAATMCGFLGWYLHLLGYFFSKFVQDDVVSTRVYGLLFRKFLFVYGIALVLSNLLTTAEGKAVMFLIGFFPLSDFSMLKEFGMKSLQGTAVQKDSLSQLPAISRWQIIRLEEEAIDNVSALAAADRQTLHVAIPIKDTVLDLWIDSARLIALIGPEKFETLRNDCLTGSEFVRRSRDPEFVDLLREKYQIGNPDELARLLQESFGVEAEPETPPAPITSTIGSRTENRASASPESEPLP